MYKGDFWGSGNVLQYLDLCGSYICKIHPTIHLRFVHFTICDSYLNFLKKCRKDYIVLGFSLLQVKVKVSRGLVELPYFIDSKAST